jgi:PAS domain S-box-containing protein
VSIGRTAAGQTQVMDDAVALERVDALQYHASLVRAMADAVIGTDAEFRVTLWNPAAERLYGYSAAEAMGGLARDLATYEGDASRRRLEAALDRDGYAHVELTARRKDGAFVDVDLIVTAVRDAHGEVVGYIGIHRDITERKRVELESRRLSAIVENSPDFIGMADLQGKVLFLNEAGQRLAGLDGMEQVRDKQVIDFFPPGERELVRDELVPRILASGREMRELHFVNFRTGERIPVSCAGFRVDDPQTGEPIAVATISRDLTERRRAEAQLQGYRAQIDTIFASITDAFYALDRDFRFTYVNDRAVQLLGELLAKPTQRGDLVGQPLYTVFPHFPGTDVERHFRHALAEQQTVAFEILTAADTRWFEVRVYPSDAGLAVYFQEITERKAAERLRQRQARQQAATAELGVRASRGENAVALMDEAAAVVSRTLDVEFVAVMEHMPDRHALLLRAGVGWDPGEVGRAEAATGTDSLAGYAVHTGAPIVSEDISLEARCAPPELLLDHGVMSGAVVPIPGRRAPFGAFGVFCRQRRRFDADEVNFLRAIANVLYSAIERAQMAQRVREVRDAERRRIARALHDETLQELSVALAAAGRRPRGGGRDASWDDGLVQALQRVGEQVRAAIHDLRLGDDHDRPFRRRVEELVGFHRAAVPGCEFTVAFGDVPQRLPGDMATHVLLIVGEALTNVRRHADAASVEVRVSVEGASLVASITDDGRGLDVDAPGAVAGGHGIVGMQERAELLGGELHVAGRAGGGTLVEVRAPLFELRPPGERARVLLVDDHAAIREAMALSFAEDAEFVVVGQAGSLTEARTMLDGIDVAIIDLALPDGYGADLIPELRAASPRAQALVLSAHVDRAARARAVQSGAAGVLDKATHLHEVVAAVRRLRAGEAMIPLDEMVELLRFAGRERERHADERRLAESLTPRELEVLQLLADGLDSQRIAARLHISPRTERNHVANILAKLGVHSQLEALVFALRHQIVDMPRGV